MEPRSTHLTAGAALALLQFIAGRLVQMIPVLFGVTLIAFFSIHLVPGDPIEIMTQGRATPETIAAMHAEYGSTSRSGSNIWPFIGNAAPGRSRPLDRAEDRVSRS